MLCQRDGVMSSCSMKDTWYISVSYRSTAAPHDVALWEHSQGDAFGNVTLSGTTAIWECRYSWSILLSTHLRLHAVAGKIESTVSEIVQKAHS